MIMMISKKSRDSFSFKLQIWGWSLIAKEEIIGCHSPAVTGTNAPMDLSHLRFSRVFLFLSPGEVKENEIEEGRKKQWAGGWGWGCWGESFKPACLHSNIEIVNDWSRDSLHENKKKPKKPFGCLFKTKLPGPCLKLTESSGLYGLGLGQSFLMGTHSDSDSKGWGSLD